jgi:hypothetical protein
LYPNLRLGLRESHQMQIVWDPLRADSTSPIPSIRYVAPSTNW